MALGARPGCFLNEIVCSLEDSSFMQKHCVCFLPEVDHLSAPWCKVLVTSEMYFTSCTVAKLFYEVYHLNFGNNILSISVCLWNWMLPTYYALVSNSRLLF